MSLPYSCGNAPGGGISLDLIHGRFSSSLEGEMQVVEREVLTSDHFTNTLLSYSFLKGSHFGISLLLEMTDDPFHLKDNQKIRYYPSTLVNLNVDNRNKISVFYGIRRGGPACNSGVCYDVLDFKGLEIRLKTRI